MGTTWDFQHPFCRKTPKKIEVGPFYEKIFLGKSHKAEKKLKGRTLWSRPVLYITRETFLVQFFGPAGTIWRLLNILQNFWGRTILVTSGVAKKIVKKI